MKSAGTPGAYAAIIRHTGRTSGRSYETPIGALAVDEGFLVTLPYGDQADWLKNVLAAGSATLVHEGETHEVDRPEVVPMDAVAGHFSSKDLRTARMFNVDQVLRLHRAPEPRSDGAGPIPDSPDGASPDGAGPIPDNG